MQPAGQHVSVRMHGMQWSAQQAEAKQILKAGGSVQG